MSRHCISVFPLFTQAQCAKLLKRFDKLPDEAPNSMNRYGRVLTGTWQRWIDKLVATKIAPMAKRCYGLALAKRGHYAFTVHYEPKRQASLSAHYDSSDVTLNVCLGTRFSGGAVVFGKITVEHAVGRAIVHSGKTTHRATKLRSGKRVNLIVWCRKANVNDHQSPDGS